MPPIVRGFGHRSRVGQAAVELCAAVFIGAYMFLAVMRKDRHGRKGPRADENGVKRIRQGQRRIFSQGKGDENEREIERRRPDFCWQVDCADFV